MKEEIIPQTILHSDTDLLMLISWKNDDLQQATDAFKSFYQRYAPYLQTISMSVSKKHQPRYDIDLAEQVLWNTFSTVWEHPEYLLDEMEDKVDATDPSLALKAALGKIAKTELYNNILSAERMFGKGIKRMPYKSAEKHHLIPVTDPEIERDESNGSENNTKWTEQEVLEIHARAMSMLPQRDQDVLKTIMEFYQKGSQIPKEVTELLCQRWEILPDNLRQIKCRALKMLKENKTKLLEFSRAPLRKA